jgi:hypothetical protein
MTMIIVYACLAAVAAGTAIAFVWLLFGRRISGFLDKCVPGRCSAMPHEPSLIQFDPAGLSSQFSLGSSNWSLSWPTQPWPAELKVLTDRQGRLVLRAGARSFTFGSVEKWWNDPVKPQYQFVAEAGDIVSFTREISRVPWPTPFTYNILCGASPKWKKFAYDRLRWRKESGSVLEVTWRSEYWWYRPTGWADNWQRRLTRVSLRWGSVEKAVTAYLAKTKGWNASEYRLESLPGSSTDAVLAAIHFEDGAATRPCGGKSVIVRVNKVSGKVVSETAFQ